MGPGLLSFGEDYGRFLKRLGDTASSSDGEESLPGRRRRRRRSLKNQRKEKKTEEVKEAGRRWWSWGITSSLILLSLVSLGSTIVSCLQPHCCSDPSNSWAILSNPVTFSYVNGPPPIWPHASLLLLVVVPRNHATPCDL